MNNKFSDKRGETELAQQTETNYNVTSLQSGKESIFFFLFSSKITILITLFISFCFLFLYNLVTRLQCMPSKMASENQLDYLLVLKQSLVSFLFPFSFSSFSFDKIHIFIVIDEQNGSPPPDNSGFFEFSFFSISFLNNLNP